MVAYRAQVNEMVNNVNVLNGRGWVNLIVRM